jgi:outer membrane receptor protein involved in Fe transport
MSLKRLASGVALSTLVSLLATSSLYAQEITGTVRGRVTEGSAPVANAAVTILHQPTGTRATAVTTADGTFDARGLRVGGPYVVTVTAKGRTTSVDVANVAVSEVTQVDVDLIAPAKVAELVVQVARAARPQPGLSTAFNAAAIQSVPTINRDLKDVVRLNPFATIDPSNSDALSFAGSNSRFNQITVDSVRQNDDFGLNNNGYPTQRTPIALEAIQALQVSVAPYSVTNDGFLGGNVNVVTKSGTNALHGSLYADTDSDRARGKKINDLPAGGNLKEKTWGATVGGPIIQDRLFFFFSYEKYEGDFSIDEGPTGSGRSVQIPRITTSTVDTVQAATKSIYGYDPGNWVSSVPPVSDTKYFGKIDFNLTDRQRVTAEFQDTHGTSFNGASIDLFTTGDSTTQPRVGLQDDQYLKDEHLTAYSFALNSTWTQNFSTEIRYGHKEQDTNRVVPGLAVGQTTVNLTNFPGLPGGSGTPQIQFGTEINSQPNYLNTFTDNTEAIARYNLGDHRLQAGIRREHDNITNIFGRQYLGSYTFATYTDFLAKKASAFALTGAVPAGAVGVPASYGTAGQAAAHLGFNLNAIYAEDTWQVLPDLSVLYGVRYNWYDQTDTPVLNQNFVSRDGFANTANLNGRGIVLPRIYAKYRPLQRLDVELGYGRFSNGGLNVWIENPWANDGVRQVNVDCPKLASGQTYNNVNLFAPPAGCTFTAGNGNVNALDPNLKIPSAWKLNFSVGYNFDLTRLKIGDNWRVQVDYLNTKNQDALTQLDLRAVQTGVAPDGRPIYGRKTNGVVGTNLFDMMLTNVSNGGGSDSAAVTLSHGWDEGLFKGLSMQAGYTYTHSTDSNPMTSSIADSSYVRFASSDPQHPSLATSDYQIRDKYQLNVNYSHKFFGDNATVFSMFAQQRSGLPFSFTFDGTRNSSTNLDNVFGTLVSQTFSGRQATSNDLFYVPAMIGGVVTANSDPRVAYTNGFDLAAFNRYLQKTGLAKYAGRIAPRNAFYGKGVGTIDLHISQEIPAFVPRGSKLQVFFDIKNLGNMLNNKWGVLQQYDFYRGVPVAGVKIVNGQYVYSNLKTAAGATDQPVQPFNIVNTSLWLARFGIKYTF